MSDKNHVRMNITLPPAVVEHLEWLAKRGHTTKSAVLLHLILEEYEAKNPAASMTPAQVRKRDERLNSTHMKHGAERWTAIDGTGHVYHCNDGVIAWGVFPGPQPAEGSGRDATTAEYRRFREETPDPPHEARDIPTHLADGQLEPKSPEDWPEFDRRAALKA